MWTLVGAAAAGVAGDENESSNSYLQHLHAYVIPLLSDLDPSYKKIQIESMLDDLIEIHCHYNRQHP